MTSEMPWATAGMPESLADLRAERMELERTLEALSASAWRTATRVDGWLVGDHVSHLAFFDEAAATAVTAPKRFQAHASARVADGLTLAEEVARKHRGRPPAELLSWLRRAQSALFDAYEAVDPQRQVPWYGTDATAVESVSGRILETWAHAQDIADALDVTREPTDRIRHVCELGVRNLSSSFELLGRPVPTVPVRVELTAPGGELWSWGRAEARDLVRGPAVDFCLVTTRRRDVGEVALETKGAVAGEWMAIARSCPAGSWPGSGFSLVSPVGRY